MDDERTPPDEHRRRHLAYEAYEALAEPYAARLETKPHNAYYERPATISLLPSVRGRRVLDAGCGPGVYAEWLLDQGAEVVGIDASPKMLELATQRLAAPIDKGRVRLFQADLSQPLDFLESHSFQIVLSALTLDYVDDWALAFGEFHRLLQPGGHLVFSIGHPLAAAVLSGTRRYFETEVVEYEWTGFGETVRVPSYRRPLGDVINPLLVAGFVLERLLEPLPTEQFRAEDPEEFDALLARPIFLCVRARKRGSRASGALVEPRRRGD